MRDDALAQHDIASRAEAFARRHFKRPDGMGLELWHSWNWYMVGTDRGERALRELAKDLALCEAKVNR